MTGEVDELLRATAAFGLAGSGCRLPEEPLAEAAWVPFLRGVSEQRLQGLLAFAVADGAFPVTPAQFQAVADEHRLLMAHVLRLERLLLRCADVLTERGIEFRLLKGSALAHLDYPDPAYRAFTDVDLLVAPADIAGAVSALGALGTRRRVPEVRPGFDQQFAKSVTLMTPGAYEIDLHRTFAMDAFGFGIDLPELFEGPDYTAIGGRAVPALPAAARFVHACYHAILGDSPPRLLPLRDVAQLMVGAAFDQDSAVRLAERWRGGPVVARAVEVATGAFELPTSSPLAIWALARPTARRERRALQGYTTARRSQVGRAVSAVGALPTMRARLQYLRALAMPATEFAASRGGRLRWIRRGARRVFARPRRNDR